MRRWSVWPWVLGLVAIAIARTRASAFSAQVQLVARAIAFAEGYGKPGAIPTVRNNPGDLILGKDKTPTTFPTADDGWRALYSQVDGMLHGTSRVYSPDMTILEAAERYTATEVVIWARNVAGYLSTNGMAGVTINTTLQRIALQEIA